MASQTFQRQFKDNAAIATATTAAAAAKTKQQKNMGIATRALRSLAVALVVPLFLTTATILFFGSAPKYRALAKPFWLPPLWLIHVASFGSSFLMGLSAWLVWAEGGFHRQPDALPLYVAQVSLSVIWDPLVLRMGAILIGLVACMVHFGTLAACRRRFRSVNPIAGDLVRPCLAWVAFLTFVNCTLLFL